MSRSAVVAGIVALVVGSLVLLFALSPTGDERQEAAPTVGKTAPAIEATTTAGEDFVLDDLRGGWVLVNFFATWCGPCKAELPDLEAFARDNGPGSVLSVAFDKKETKDDYEKFFAGTEETWPVITRGGASFAIDWGVIKLPESYLVAPNGKVVLKINGGVQASRLESYIAQAEGR